MQDMGDLDRKIQAEMPRYKTNDGHGPVWARPDGQRARCGGAGMCTQCSKDYSLLESARQRVAESAE